MPSGDATREANRPVVYLLHGLLETAAGHFGPQLRSWSAGCRLVPLDLPGHGNCRVDVDGSCLSPTVDYVTAVLDRFGPGRLVAASYLGGPAAVQVAARRPELVRSLVLTGVVPDVPADVFVGWVRSVQEVACNGAMASAYDAVHGRRWRRTLDGYVADVANRYEEVVQVRRDVLADIGVSVLIANGARKSAERQAASSAAKIGVEVRGAVVDDAGHIPGRDQPAAFEAAVANFWAETEASHVGA
jgi:pimeloyl-ACP methyl ester carboxylesterase